MFIYDAGNVLGGRTNGVPDASKQVGDRDYLKVFASADAAETWLEDNDSEGLAFEYEVLE